MGFFNTPREEDNHLRQLRALMDKTILPSEVRAVIEREMGLLENLNISSAEHAIGVAYINYLLSMPWGVRAEETMDIERVGRVLNERHYGLAHVKERILEHLAVMQLRHGRRRVLVVDDDAAALKNLRHILSSTGAEALGAAGAEEALALLETEDVDVVLTDLNMKGMHGTELIEKLKARLPGVPVIVVTGYGSIDSAVECMKHGAFHYITKPYKIDEVRDAVARAASSRTGRHSTEGSVLCLAGPPGSGKTSLGRAIADALGRPFVRIALGGIRDESEIRGHRRTYAGALPGRLVEEIRRAGCVNPVIMLDEIDKAGQDAKGDPLAALLEVLDPEQNHAFLDHYLDVPLDLSSVFFVATANVPDMVPDPLRDRMELLELEGYGEEEKVRIALDYLVPRQTRKSALGGGITFTEEALQKIVRQHTSEAGIRNLERKIAAICRKKAVEKLKGPGFNPVIDAPAIDALLGPGRFHRDEPQFEPRIGRATGLVIGPSGGDTITIETLSMKGSGELILTGSLGDVMRESALAALSYVKSRATEFGIGDEAFTNVDIHVHIPAGATPKDGPSAGATIALALISLFLKRPLRHMIAVSGELTLSGALLPVGGVRQKLLAARRAGISKVFLPLANRPEAEAFGHPEMVALCSLMEEIVPQAF